MKRSKMFTDKFVLIENIGPNRQTKNVTFICRRFLAIQMYLEYLN